MRVAMYYNNSDVRIEEMPKPEAGPGEILVKVVASGICGSDVMEWYRIKKAPRVLGHEITGDIVQIGEGVERYHVGDRVFVSHHVPCNTCRYCLAGNHTVCETLHTTNFDPGGFAEFVRAPRINVDRGTFALPDEMSYVQGVFIEPLACVVRAQRAMQLRQGQSVLILGSGIAGMLHLVQAKASGAGRIVMTDVNEFRMNMAQELGADAVIDGREDVAAIAKEANRGELFDQVIICAGAFPVFKQALDSVDRGGTVMFFATTEPGVDVPVPANEFWRNSVTLLPSYANSPYDAAVAMELIRSGRVDVDPLVTHRLPLDEAQEGFRLVAGAGESMKVILEP